MTLEERFGEKEYQRLRDLANTASFYGQPVKDMGAWDLRVTIAVLLEAREVLVRLDILRRAGLIDEIRGSVTPPIPPAEQG